LARHAGNAIECPRGDETDDGKNEIKNKSGVMIISCHVDRVERDSEAASQGEWFSVEGL